MILEIEQEQDPYLRQQLMELYNPMGQQNAIQPEAYFENAEDIINEEEYEESIMVDGNTSRRDTLMQSLKKESIEVALIAPAND